MRRLATATASIVLVCALPVPLAAQGFPAKPIRLISPYPPGGGNDTLARLLVERLSEGLGQRIVVDNRPGANTIVGTEMLAKSAPDGHTLILLPNSFVTNPAFYRKLPYDTLRDFAPVGLIAVSPNMLVVHPSLPARSLKEFIALGRGKPGEIAFGSSGNGSTGHLAGVLFDMLTGTTLTHVAYKGTAPAVTELLGGHIPVMFSSMLATLPHVRGGRLRLLGLTTARRSPTLPDVPTIAESGVPGYEAILWYGVIARGTPPAILGRLHAEFDKAVKAPEVREKLAAQAVEPQTNGPDAFAAQIRAEVALWAKVLAKAGIKAE